jgi:hypothetical protein
MYFFVKKHKKLKKHKILIFGVERAEMVIFFDEKF